MRMTKTQQDKLRRAAINAAYIATDCAEQAHLDEAADRIIEHVKTTSKHGQMSRDGALEVLAAIGRVI